MTIPLISKHSLGSPWVAVEISRAFAAERFAGKRFIPCRLDKALFEIGFVNEKTDEIEERISQIEEERDTSRQKTRKTGYLNVQIERLEELRDDLPEIVKRLQSTLTVDVAGEAFEGGVARLITTITGREEVGGEEAPTPEAAEPEATPAEIPTPEPPPAPPLPWWRVHIAKIIAAVVLAGLFGWVAYTVPRLQRVDDNARAVTLEFLAHLGERNVDGIAGMVGLPFYLGSDRLEELEAVHTRFSNMFQHAREETEQQSDSNQIRGGAVLARYIAQQSAIAGVNLPGLFRFQVRADLGSEDEKDRESILLPSPELLKKGARVTATIPALGSPAVGRVHFYYSVLDDDTVRLRAMVIEEP